MTSPFALGPVMSACVQRSGEKSTSMVCAPMMIRLTLTGAGAGVFNFQMVLIQERREGTKKQRSGVANTSEAIKPRCDRV